MTQLSSTRTENIEVLWLMKEEVASCIQTTFITCRIIIHTNNMHSNIQIRACMCTTV